MQAVIFDVEGTLIDCVPQTLESWRETLAASGFEFTADQLHAFSGMDGDDMLNALLPENGGDDLKRSIIEEQGRRYREKFLAGVKPFPDVRPLFDDMRLRGLKIALATTCGADELRHYTSLLDVADMVHASACGDDSRHGKPHPDLYRIVLKRLSVAGERAIAVGDSPFDAIAANMQGLRAIGTLTGGFSTDDLTVAGCISVIKAPAELAAALDKIDLA